MAAAIRLLHQQGIERTTLADIAKVADVPAGNVYYYFKTKDEVIAAVIEAHAQQIKTTLAVHRRPPPIPQEPVEGARARIRRPERDRGPVRLPARKPLLGTDKRVAERRLRGSRTDAPPDRVG